MDYFYYKANKSGMNDFSSRLMGLLRAGKKPIFVCIGTDKSTGDSLGPITGSLLSDSFYLNGLHYPVYGTLKNPVHALNIGQYISRVSIFRKNCTIVAIDASLGEMSHVGEITLASGPIFPGKGVKKTMPAIGDISITGIVNSYDASDYEILQTTRLYSVVHMSRMIAYSITDVLMKY